MKAFPSSRPPQHFREPLRRAAGPGHSWGASCALGAFTPRGASCTLGGAHSWGASCALGALTPRGRPVPWGAFTPGGRPVPWGAFTPRERPVPWGCSLPGGVLCSGGWPGVYGPVVSLTPLQPPCLQARPASPEDPVGQTHLGEGREKGPLGSADLLLMEARTRGRQCELGPGRGTPAACTGPACPALWGHQLQSEADGPGRRPSHARMRSPH